MTTTAEGFPMGEAFNRHSDRHSDADTGSQNLDPLRHLSKKPRMDLAGYYVDGGLSPYSVEFLKPLNSFLADWGTGESLVDYVRKKQEADENAVTALVRDGLPREIPAPKPVDHTPNSQNIRCRAFGLATFRAIFRKDSKNKD